MAKPAILVVDDDRSITSVLDRSLSDEFNVFTANSGQAALDILRRQEIAVILTDQRMPGLTGVQLLERAQKIQPNAVGILLSGYSDGVALARAINLGSVHAYIAKPWNHDELRQQLSDAIQKYQAIFQEHEGRHEPADIVAQAEAQITEVRRALDLLAARQVGAFLRADNGRLPTDGALAGEGLDQEYLDHLSDGFALLRGEGEILYANPSFERLLSLDGQIGMGAALLTVPHLNGCEKLVEALHSALHGRHARADFALTDPQGNRRCLEVAATPVPEGRGDYQAVLILRDQTERVQTLAYLGGLNKVAEAVIGTIDFKQMIRQALTACCEATAADAAIIYVLEADQQALALAGGDGLQPETLEFLGQNSRAVGQGQLGEVLAEGRPRAIPDLGQVQLTYPQVVQREGLVSAALAPLRDQNGISGVLGIYTRSLRLFTESDLQFLASIGSQVGLALDNARLLDRLQEEARTDGLTGLLNRRYFTELAEREYRRAQRYGSDLVVLMIDVDDFKEVNDTYGHAAGDRVLQAVAACLKAAGRSIDLIARYGGDEFVVLLVDCSEAEAEQIVQRMKSRVAAVRIPVGDGAIGAGVSVGRAAAALAGGESLHTLMEQADAAMYQAKAQPAASP
ncbi:MAG TPA: diguanylate cyclase [Ardenticatenaceae bacterium]|nr:diguanylate cyclase [Ardenticatenaceae bacterium]